MFNFVQFVLRHYCYYKNGKPTPYVLPMSFLFHPQEEVSIQPTYTGKTL